nr:helix-turn-helix transcriptional regulator [Bradyrhizobium campsiandrae]
MQSLRLVAPSPDRVAAGKAGRGTFDDKRVTALTDLERKIMRLVACGMSDREIARELKMATGTINARVEHISARLQIKDRRQLATFALSRLYGGVGALAALIWAALDDVQPATAAAVDHAHSDPVTVLTADGTGAVLAIKITPQKTTAAPGRTAKAVGKAGCIGTSVAESSTRAGNLFESRADIVASTVPLLAPAASRLGLSSFGAFALMAVGVSILELLDSPAQAFTFSDNPSGLLSPDVATATAEFAAFNRDGGVDANLNGFVDTAWLDSAPQTELFAFAGARGDTVVRGDELLIPHAAATEDSARGGGNVHVGAGAVDALSGHGGSGQADGTDTARNAEPGTPQPTEADGPDHGPLQADVQVSEDGAAKGKPHADHEPAGQDPAQRQSQREVHVSEQGAVKGKPHADHQPPGHDPVQSQSQRDMHVSEQGNAKSKPHAGQETSGHGSDRGQSHRDAGASKDAPTDNHINSDKTQPKLHKAHLSSADTPHAGPSENGHGNSQAADAFGRTQTATAPELRDSFRFKNDMAAPNHSSHIEDSQRPLADGNELHNAGHQGLAPIEYADLIGPSHAVQGFGDHTGSFEHHLTHDLLI